ncbi:MAG: hypothetical protein IIT32_02650 [Bacteroidales bacterium]|nr:hypothetical protein [Bacteroidales bacterium]
MRWFRRWSKSCSTTRFWCRRVLPLSGRRCCPAWKS